jgi:hypothetical protein
MGLGVVECLEPDAYFGHAMIQHAR